MIDHSLQSWEEIQASIDSAWEERNQISPESRGDVKSVVNYVLNELDQGKLRVAENKSKGWEVNEWIKKAVLLSFRLKGNVYHGRPVHAYDKVPLKFQGWGEEDFKKSGIRAIPGSIVRHGAYVGPDVVLMPSFVNIGAYVGEGTMVDTWVTIGSCAQVGKNCHISGGVGLGGVLEPLQANPVIIEDHCFIGARSEVVEGVIVGEGAVIGMGVFVGQSTPIVDGKTGEIHYGKVPPYSVVIAGSLPGKAFQDGREGPNLTCAVIIKQVDEKTRSKTNINDLLRP